MRTSKPPARLARPASLRALLVCALATSALATSALPLTACDDDPVEVSTTPLIHSDAHALVQSRVDSYGAKLDQRLSFLNGDTSIFAALDRLLGALGDSEDSEEEWESYPCISYDAEGNEIPCEEDPNYIPFPEEPEYEDGGEEEAIELRLESDARDMVTELLERLPERAILRDETQLTYALDPRDLCGEMSFSEEGESEEEGFPGEYPEGDFAEGDFAEGGFAEGGFAEGGFAEGGFAEGGFAEGGFAEGEPDPACLEMMERQQPRVTIEGTEARLTGTLRTTAGVVATVTLTSDEGGVSLSLDTLHALLVDAATTSARHSGEPAPTLPTFGGAVSARLDFTGEQGVELSLNVDRAVSVSGAFDDVASDLSLTLAPSRIFSVRVDGASELIGAALNLGRLNASASGVDLSAEEYDEYGEPIPAATPAPRRAVALDLGGLNLDASLDLRDALKLLMTAGLGDSSTTLKVDGAQILKVDVNPTAARRVSFELSLAEGAAGAAGAEGAGADALVMALTSALMGLSAEWDLTSLTELTDFQLPRRDAARVELSPVGGAASLRFAEELKVLAGRLTLASGGREVVVEAGQCAVEHAEEGAEEEAEGEGEASALFSSVEAGVCAE